MSKTLEKIKLDEEVLSIEDVLEESKLILHNDEINTFDWVIKSLIDICNHTMVQAEQCSMLIHYRGKYAVKHGPFKTLKAMKEAFTDRGIGATIE